MPPMLPKVAPLVASKMIAYLESVAIDDRKQGQPFAIHSMVECLQKGY